jgi:hypothetical protein
MKRLVVQATGDVCKHSRAHAWGRVNIKKSGPSIVIIANWPWNYKRDFPLEDNPLHWLGFIGIWILTCIVVSILQLFILSRRGKYTGYYPPLPFKLWEYPKEWKTLDENALVSTEIPAANPLYPTSLALEPKPGEHAQRPRRLCVINTVGGNIEYEVKDTEDYEIDKVPPYVFISFTSAQFPCQKGRTRKASQSGQPLVPKLGAQPGRPTPPTGQPSRLADQVEEMELMDGPYGAQLVSLAIHATRAEEKEAFWLSEQCLLAPIDEVNENMRKNNKPEIGEKEYNEEKTKEIHIMSDIIRGAAAIVIILGQPPGAVSARCLLLYIFLAISDGFDGSRNRLKKKVPGSPRPQQNCWTRTNCLKIGGDVCGHFQSC